METARIELAFLLCKRSVLTIYTIFPSVGYYLSKCTYRINGPIMIIIIIGYDVPAYKVMTELRIILPRNNDHIHVEIYY